MSLTSRVPRGEGMRRQPAVDDKEYPTCPYCLELHLAGSRASRLGVHVLLTSLGGVDIWGTLPDWLSAGGTIAAVWWAVRASRHDRARLLAEQRQSAEDRAAFREEQARQAEAWKRRLAAKVSVSAERAYVDGKKAVRWIVHNGGDEPISRVLLLQRLLDTSAPSPVEQVAIWTTIEAGGRREHVAVLYRESTDYDQQGREVHFTDGADQRWQRTTWGVLRELGEDDPQRPRIAYVPVV